MQSSLLRMTALGMLVAFGCARETPSSASKTNAAGASKPSPAMRSETRSATHTNVPGPLRESGFQHGRHAAPSAAPAPLKNVGKLGEALESDVFTFKLVSVAPCGEQPDPATAKPSARRVVAAEVEITAKQGLTISPRDVAIGVGGIVFNGATDRARKLDGCNPRLETSVLLPEKSTRGYVLFDIPVTGPGSDLAQMGLIYQPTRFGGAGPVMVPSFGG